MRTTSYAEPVIKWAGGKRQLLPVLTDRLEAVDCRGTYYEPFVGGGALFLALGHAPAVINDANPAITGLYRTIRDYPESLMEQLDVMAELYNDRDEEGRKDYYLKVRNRFNSRIGADGSYRPMLRTADLIFLNKTCFNGLYRENAKGEFNVPWGKRETVNLYDPNNIRRISRLMQSVNSENMDFEEAVKDAERGDVVFMDPPYHKTFTGYRGGGFSEDDQRRVARVFRDLTDRGCRVLATNSDTPLIRELYEGFDITELAVKRQINRDANGRTGTELLIDNGVWIG